MEREYIERYVTETVGGGLTCKEFVELVTDYLDESLTFGRWIQFQLHLGVCRGCRNYLKQMKETVQRLGDLQQAPPPEAVRQALQQRFQTWAGSRRGGA
ncbi:MAG: zf-HC2 domain-containing protein [Nitrospirae bacterium]|nr:zf-HC2 domain-containing protein [Nitrospirota bacterium]